MTTSTPTNPAATALDAVVTEHFGGDFTLALLALARRGEIAVAYLDRRWFAGYLAERGMTLTDEMWEQIAADIEDYDEYVGRAGTDTDYAMHVLTRESSADDEYDNSAG